MKQNRLKHIVIAVAVSVLTGLSIWALCYPISIHMAKDNFEDYMIEYSIDKSDIESYDIRKSFTLSPVEIIVIYKSEPEYIYSYSYPICYFISNKPEYVSVKTDGVWYSATEIYEKLEHPAVSINYP